MKKIISIMICITLLTSTIIITHADSKEAPLTTNKILTRSLNIDEMYNAFDEAGFEMKLIKKSDNAAEYILSSTSDVSFESHVNAFLDSEGNQILKISEGDKSDVVQLNVDGTVLLNNFPVRMSSEEIVDKNSDTQEITPQAQRMYYQKDAPYGMNYHYTTFFSTHKRAMYFEQAISDYTTGALAALVIGALVSGNVPAILISGALNVVIGWFKANSPTAKAWSFEESRYVHNTNGFNVTSSMSTYRVNITYFAYPNYTAPVGSDQFWQVWSY